MSTLFMRLDSAAEEILDNAEKVRAETAGKLFTTVCDQAAEAGRVVQGIAWDALQVDRAVQTLTTAIAKWQEAAPTDSEIDSAKSYYEVQEDYGDDELKKKAFDAWQDLVAARAKADRALIAACNEMMKVINALSDQHRRGHVGDPTPWGTPGSEEPLTPYRPSTPNKPRVAPTPSPAPLPRTDLTTGTGTGTEAPAPALTRPGSSMPTMPQVQTPTAAPAPVAAAANPAPTAAARPTPRSATDKSLDADADPTPVPLHLPLTGTTAGPTATATTPAPPPSGPTGQSISGATTQSEVHGRPAPTGLTGVTGSNATTTTTAPAATAAHGHGGGGGYMPPVAGMGGAAPGAGAPNSKREPDTVRKVDPTLHNPSIVRDGTIAQRRDTDQPEREKQ